MAPRNIMLAAAGLTACGARCFLASIEAVANLRGAAPSQGFGSALLHDGHRWHRLVDAAAWPDELSPCLLVQL